MGILVITSHDADEVDEALYGHRGPVAIEGVEDFDWDDLNQVRWLLSLRDLDSPAIIESDEGTVDELIDWVVRHLAREKPGMRMRAPETLTDAEWQRIRDRLEPASDFRFYLDGEAEPLDSGLLYDKYEDCIFPDEW